MVKLIVIFTVARCTNIIESQTQFGAYEEISLVSMDNSSPQAKGPRFRTLIEKAYTQLNQGIALQHILEVTIARKAMSEEI